MKKWIRARFKADPDDYRPVKWPPPGPYWCTGFSEEHSVVVAYVKSRREILQFWPEAKDIDIHERGVDIEFTDRFQKPRWWKPELATTAKAARGKP